jgi:hypothetical protein
MMSNGFVTDKGGTLMNVVTRMTLGLALCGWVGSGMCLAQEQAESLSKVFLAMPPPMIDVEFRPLLEYTPAVIKPNSANRAAWERHVAQASRLAAVALNDEVRAAIEASVQGAATLIDAPISAHSDDDKAIDDKAIAEALTKLPFMKKRGSLVTVVVNNISLVGDHEGTVVNPRPDQSQVKTTGFFDTLKSVARSASNLSQGNTPLTFDGVTHVRYQVRYKVYATANGELLRDGQIGPLSADSAAWKASWSFPATCFDGNCDPVIFVARAANDGQFITDPRPQLLPEAIERIKPQIADAVKMSFSDWPDLLAAGQELAARR